MYYKDVALVSELFFKAWEWEKERRERSWGTEDGDKRRNGRLWGLLHGSVGMKEEIRWNERLSR